MMVVVGGLNCLELASSSGKEVALALIVMLCWLTSLEADLQEALLCRSCS